MITLGDNVLILRYDHSLTHLQLDVLSYAPSKVSINFYDAVHSASTIWFTYLRLILQIDHFHLCRASLTDTVSSAVTTRNTVSRFDPTLPPGLSVFNTIKSALSMANIRSINRSLLEATFDATL
eukprot:jgi/Psemu1/309460/fgenesh1_kg.513_\